MPTIRPYSPSDEPGWLRCRVLSFLGTSYFDDVKRAKTRFGGAAIELVATVDARIAGVIDVELDGALATIDTIAVHPDHARRGIASALLAAALERLPGDVRELDAWTREDPEANAWYRDRGFVVDTRYLHVYLGEGDDPEGFVTPDGLSAPVHAFCHASLDREAELRARYARVHECRRYVRAV
jgi:ribosomal protein S18 acetylase RimI-like enzyme